MIKKNVSLADIAKIMKTSPATVSRALRNESCISVATRRLAAALAKELGYRKDPEVDRLMARVRALREPGFQSVLGVLVDSETTSKLDEDPYIRRVIAGASVRANELGYSLDMIGLREKGMHQARLEGILQTRAIHGVLIPPQTDLPHNIVLPKNNVAMVAATAARAHLGLHRVFPDHFANVCLVIGEVAAAGHQRIGLITTEEMEERQRHGPIAAYEWFMSTHPSFPRIPPIVLANNPLTIRPWFEQNRPSALVMSDSWVCRVIKDLLREGEVGVALFGNRREGFAGIDELPETVGAAAIDLLSAQVVRGEYGVPRHCKNVMIAGEFVHGPSLRRRESR